LVVFVILTTKEAWSAKRTVHKVVWTTLFENKLCLVWFIECMRLDDRNVLVFGLNNILTCFPIL